MIDEAPWDAGDDYRAAIDLAEKLDDRVKDLLSAVELLPRRHRKNRGVGGFRTLVQGLSPTTLFTTCSTPYGDIVEPSPSWVDDSERLEARLGAFERNFCVLVTMLDEIVTRLHQNLRVLLDLTDDLDETTTAPIDRPDIGEPSGWPIVAFPVQRHAPPVARAQHHGPAAKVAA